MELDEFRTSSEQTEVTSVLCFAFADMAAIRALRGEIPGDHVQLVPGIDRDLEGLVVQLLGDTPAVIVAVHSPELSADRLDEVLATFSRLRDRNHRLCVVEFDHNAPTAFLATVGAAVDDMRGRGGTSSSLSRPPSGPSTMQRRAPASAAPVMAGRAEGALDEVADAPRVVANTLGGIGDAPAPAVEPPPVAEPPADLHGRDEVAGLDRDEGLDPPSEVVRAIEPMAAGLSDDTLTSTRPGPLESGTTIPDLGLPISNVRRRQVAQARRRSAWRRTVVAAAFLGVAGVAGVLVWSGGVSGLRRSAQDSPPAARPDLAPRKASLAPRPTEDGARRDDVPEKPNSDSPARVAVADGAAAESRRVAAALDAKQMRALDALLIRTASRQPERFADARKRCTRMDVAELQGWRLPSLDELRTLRRARMLPAGEYWSGSRGDENVIFTLSRDVTRPQERERSDADNVRTLCVRQR